MHGGNEQETPSNYLVIPMIQVTSSKRGGIWSVFEKVRAAKDGQSRVFGTVGQ